MIEWVVVSVLFLALFVLGARKGWRHMTAPRLPVLIIVIGGLAAYLLESLPFTPFAARPSVQTLLAVVCGVLGGRMVARGFAGWGRAWERDAAKGHPPKADLRLIHPLVAAGLWVAIVPVLYTLVAARHETLETLATPRDPETLIVRGAEAVALDGDPAKSHGVLLIHGFLGSPADFGDLPKALQAKGFSVRAPRLPGHGRLPGDVAGVTAKDYDDAVAAARAELEKTHAKVSLVGFSFGGSLALRSAAVKPPHRLVLVNPYIGRTATPSWLPVSTDTLFSISEATLSRVFRPPGFTRVNDPAGREKQGAYSTVSLAGAGVARRMAEESAAVTPRDLPVAVLVSKGDRSIPADDTEKWMAGAAKGSTFVVYDRSDHLLFLDYDREAAAEEVIRALSD